MAADVVVAGAGHNSLIAAAYLAKAGLEVIVLEGREIIGGNTVTEELTLPGFKHDSCSSAHVLIQSNPLLRNDELSLGRYGLHYVFTDPAVVMLLREHDSITMWRERARTAAGIERFSERDAAAYITLLNEWDHGLKQVHSRVQNFPPADLDDNEVSLRYKKLSAMSARDVVYERFEHEDVRSLIMWLSFATIQDIDRPGTGILPLAVTAGRQEFGWATPLGGSGMLPRALASLIEDHGGRVVTGAAVVEITIENGRASGVVTASGDRYRARRAVLSTIHAARLVEVFDGNVVPDDFRFAIQNWKPGLTLFATHLALPSIPSFATGRGTWISSTAGAYGSPEGLTKQIAAHQAGRTYDDDPWILVVNACAVDPDRAPDGGATLKLLTIAPRELSKTKWSEER